MLGSDIKEKTLFRQLSGILGDIFLSFMKSLMIKEQPQKVFQQTTSEGSPILTKIADLSKFLGKKEYILGHITQIGFDLAYLIRFIQAMAKGMEGVCPFAQHANLMALTKRIESLPRVSELVQKRKHVPFMPPAVTSIKMASQAEAESD